MDVYDPGARLHQSAPNFYHREVARSHTASRLGIDNEPPFCVLENAKNLALNVLQPIRDRFGAFIPNSRYRSEDLEKVIAKKGYARWLKKHGVRDPPDNWDWYFERKQHPTGRAADIELPSISNEELYLWIRENILFDQLILEFHTKGDPHSGWVHVSYNAGRNRRHSFGIN